MKKLTYTIVSTCAAFLFLAACTKDQAPVPQNTRPDLPIVQKVTTSGNSIDLSLFAYSNLPPGTRYEFSIGGQYVEYLTVNTPLKKEWHLGKLNPGVQRVNIHVGTIDAILEGQCNFFFNVYDGSAVQSVRAGKITDHDFGFDLLIN